MRILALDTSTQKGSIALLEGDELVAELRVNSMETHSARLLGNMEFLLAHAGWKLEDLGLIAAGIGPGSFTGIRIGISSAMGLAQTLSIAFAGISCLDATAYAIREIQGLIGVVLDAQRSQVYWAEYINGANNCRKIGKPALLFPADLKPRLRGQKVHLVGDGAWRYAKDMNLPNVGWPRLIAFDSYLAPAMGRLALKRKRSWRSGDFLQSEPLYIRPPDAVRRKVKNR